MAERLAERHLDRIRAIVWRAGWFAGRAYRRAERLHWGWGLAAGVLAGAGLGVIVYVASGGIAGPLVGLAALALAVPLVFLGRTVIAPLAEPEMAPSPAARRTGDLEPGDEVPEAESPEPAPFSVVEDIPGLLKMVALPAGEFLMGSPEDDNMAFANENPQHPVHVNAFLIAQTPVTRGLYREVMGEGRPEWGEGDDLLPATDVSWDDAVAFWDALNRRPGLPGGYRLPAEAEWEYAARAGKTTRWFWGDGEAEAGEYAWFEDNSKRKVHPVAAKAPNPWGLYDMAGNVWEWCADWYGPYEAGRADNPTGPEEGSSRVVRGGSAWFDPRSLRSAVRDGLFPEIRDGDVGFRCVRVPGRQP